MPATILDYKSLESLTSNAPSTTDLSYDDSVMGWGPQVGVVSMVNWLG